MAKRKMTLETLVSLGYDYIDSMPVYSPKTGKKGIRYILEKYLTDDETKALNIPFIDKVFTVWDNKETAANNHVTINCGARSCNTCRRCYSRRTAKLINELLK